MNPDNQHENENPPQPPLPEFDLGMPLTAITTETKGPLKQRETKASLVLLFIIVGMLLLSTLLRRGSTVNTLAARADSISDAIRDCKIAFVQHQFAEPQEGKNQRLQGRIETKTRVLEALREIAQSSEASPGDLRRYAIAIGSLDSLSNPEILRTVRRLYKIKPRTSKRQKTGEVAREILDGKFVLPPDQEVALWTKLYGQEEPRLTSSDVAVMRSQIEQFELGWFENLALARLYERGGLAREKQAIQDRALYSANMLTRLFMLQNLAVFCGFVAWCFIGLRLRRALQITTPSVPSAPEDAPLRLSYTIRVQTFALYLGLPLLLSSLIPFLRVFWGRPTPVMAVRIDGFLYLLESVLILGCCVFALRRLYEREGKGESVGLSLLLSQLGFRAPQPLMLVYRGICAYALILLPMALAAILSSVVFRNYTTPAHPLSLSFMLLKSPWDWVLLFVQTAVMAPLVEETLFRGVLYPALREKWGVWQGIALTSAVFSILHPNMPAGFLPLFVLGAGMALLYEKSRSLLPAMVLHAINNGFILFMQAMIMTK